MTSLEPSLVPKETIPAHLSCFFPRRSRSCTAGYNLPCSAESGSQCKSNREKRSLSTSRPRAAALSPPKRGPAGAGAVRLRRVLGVRGLPPGVRPAQLRARILTDRLRARALAVPMRRPRGPENEGSFAGRGAPVRVGAKPGSAERSWKLATARRPSVHMLFAICGGSALLLRECRAPPGGHGLQPQIPFFCWLGK